MRFKISLQDKPRHSDLVSCVGWMTPDELYSCGDDHQLLRWSLLNAETSKVADLPAEVFPLEMHWMPRSAIQGGKAGADIIFLLTAADGKFHLVSRKGRIEKSVDAHQGAALAGRWSHDGSSILTGGEDGLVKIWSRSGMLRSSLAMSSGPVYSAAWSPDSDAVLYTSGTALVIKPLAPNTKPIQWKAHEALVLKVAWNPNTGLIISGGEDTRYRVWDRYGRQLYTSPPHHHPITALAWAPDGQLFAVGSYNTLRLCDKAGWSHSLDKPGCGSLFNLAWSSDGTQVAGAGGNGHVLFAHVIENNLEWHNYEATVISRTAIALRNVNNDAKEQLELRDRIIKVSLAYGHLIVVTASQVYVYSTRNWNTPIIFDLKEGSVSLIVQAERHFLVVDGSSVVLYTYEGRVVSSPRWPRMRTDVLSARTVALSNDTLAIRDKDNEKGIHLFDATTGKLLNDGKPWEHKVEIAEVTLDQVGPTQQRCMGIVDNNRDLFLVQLKRVGGMGRGYKLGGMVQSLKWNDGANILATLQDSNLVVWFYPGVIFVDRTLLHYTQSHRDATTPNQLGKNRTEDLVWAVLAGMATAGRNLETAEVAYAAINETDKVHYINKIKSIPVKEAQVAEMAQLSGDTAAAEHQLLQAGLQFRAIMLHVTLHNWERALELALRHNTHVGTVLAYRKRYLARFGNHETLSLFLKNQDKVENNWSKVQAAVEAEYQKERERRTN
ncbi:intraflagellar transport protein 80 homolog [Hyalella azteca]|uniref:Intraflagellar transport protein 80 homolog n=1 Tax=Hyalella azteca TaxID=294128 RepID=A0A8B7P1Q9_HYAAZ|nr:intraflagellar transport protein 80 homolog [Hyalella azteca]